MASLQRFSSHGHAYWRIVESFRRPDGRPTVRTLMYLGKADDLLARLQGQDGRLQVRSVSSGATDALFRLAGELGVADAIDAAVQKTGGSPQTRDGLTIGQSLVAAAVARVCHPSSKRAFAEWSRHTSLPDLLGVKADALTSQHFWDQMDAVPVEAIAPAEADVVARVMSAEKLQPGLLAYDTTNFFTHIASTNGASQLARRGHNKNGRHDLRQLGLALVVSEEGQIPLAHAFYDGARPDVVTFAQELEPLRRRLRQVLGDNRQLTFVFDQGAESTDNLAAVRGGGDHYVTALKPSRHRAWLADVVEKLVPVRLASGEVVRAFRTQMPVHGVEQTVVAVFSQRLFDGQKRGLEQHLRKALERLGRISDHPRGGIEGARAQVARICHKQYLREILHATVEAKGRRVVITPQVDEAKRKKLETAYFGLRILATTRDDASAAQIIDAYRGQARVERAFRDLKDPWVCAFRPQYHWTDQKLRVHAFTAILGLILGRVLLRRAQRAVSFEGGLRRLISRLSTVRTSTILRSHEDGGRPRVTHYTEQCDPVVARLATALGVAISAER